MKEKLIQEISNAMTEILSVEQMAQLNGVLLQVVSKYTITEDGEKAHEEAASNDRLLEIFLSAILQPSNITVLPFGSFSRKCPRRWSIIPRKIFGHTWLCSSVSTNPAK